MSNMFNMGSNCPKHNDIVTFCTNKSQVRQLRTELECGPMPNVMAALPNIGGAVCSTPQSLAGATTRVPCSNTGVILNTRVHGRRSTLPVNDDP